MTGTGILGHHGGEGDAWLEPWAHQVRFELFRLVVEESQKSVSLLKCHLDPGLLTISSLLLISRQSDALCACSPLFGWSAVKVVLSSL